MVIPPSFLGPFSILGNQAMIVQFDYLNSIICSPDYLLGRAACSLHFYRSVLTDTFFAVHAYSCFGGLSQAF
jgi:hypothetical protein